MDNSRVCEAKTVVPMDDGPNDPMTLNHRLIPYFCNKISGMDLSSETIQLTIVISLFIFFLAVIWLLIGFKNLKEEVLKRTDGSNDTKRLTLQAYERLTLFTERSSLKNLVSRTPATGLTVVDMQLGLADTIRAEYEHNVSQQIYVADDMWKAIVNFKDQNIYIINQLAATLPSQANGIELSKRILEYVLNNNADLSAIVLEALSYEAKKIL